MRGWTLYTTILLFATIVFSCSTNQDREHSHSDKDFERVSVAVRQHEAGARAMVDSALMASTDSLTYYDYYLLLGCLYILNAPDSALMCANRTLRYAQGQPVSPCINGIAGAAYNLKANYYYLYRQNTDEVLKDNMEAYRLFMQSDLIKNTPAICANIGDAYNMRNLLPDAASWYRRALVLADSLDLPEVKRVTFYMGLGGIYQKLGDYNLSEEYFEKSRKDYDQMHANMKMTYLNNYGNLQYFKKDFGKALSVFQELDSIIGALNLRGGFEDYLCRLNMSDVLQNLGRTKESLEILAPADSFFRANKVNDGVYYANTIRIANALRQDDMSAARQIIGTEPKGLTADENMIDIRNRYLYDYYVKTGDKVRADYYQTLYNERKDSVDRSREYMRASDIVARLTIDTLTLHKQLRIEEKNAIIKRNLLIFTLVVSIALLTVMGLLVWTLYLRKRNADKERQIMDLTIANVRNSITPHFTFNVLKHATMLESHDAENTIRGIIKLMHSQLDISKNLFATLRKELEFTQAYVDVAAMTMGSDFSFHAIIPEETVLDSRLVPSTFIQILAENAIKHGLKGLDRPKSLIVKIVAEDNKTIIEVTDNGRGFDITSRYPQNDDHGTGTGLRVIHNTINYYNTTHREEMEFDIDNIYDDDGRVTGCRSVIVMPLLVKYS